MVFIIAIVASFIFLDLLRVLYGSDERISLRKLKGSQFSSILAGMPKNYIATPISRKSLMPAKDADSKLELTDPLTVEFDSVDSVDLENLRRLSQCSKGTLYWKAVTLIQSMKKIGQHNLSVEDKHSLGVIIEQFVVSVRLFEGLPETRKDRALKDQLWNQWNTLELAAADIHVRMVEDSVKQLKISSSFVESKFSNGLQIRKSGNEK